jgi:hypothetical protein
MGGDESVVGGGCRLQPSHHQFLEEAFDLSIHIYNDHKASWIETTTHGKTHLYKHQPNEEMEIFEDCTQTASTLGGKL